MIIYQFENIGHTYDYKHNCHSKWYVPLHLHEYSEFVFTEKGVFRMHLNGKEYIVPENHLIFVCPNQLHDCYSEDSSIVHCVVFSNDFAPIFRSIAKGMEFENPVFDFSDNTDVIKELAGTDPSKALKICGLLNMILDFMLENGNVVPKHKGDQNFDNLHLIIEYISNNFKEDVHLSDMAKKIGYHEKYLSSAIRSTIGMNFRTFLALYRINYAKNLLLNSRYTISEIAAQCGFSSINTFNRMFLKLTNLTPSEFKQKNTPEKVLEANYTPQK